MLQELKPLKRRKLSLSLPRNTASILFAFLIGLGVGYILILPKNVDLPLGSTHQELPFKVCFSPKGKCSRLIVSTIENAEASILVMAYSFTSPQIAEALINAHHQGIDVKILIDKSQVNDGHSQLSYLATEGIPIFIDTTQGLAHNKVMIFDSRTVLTGSFNFTRAADNRNAENVLIIYDPTLAEAYRNNWDWRAQKSQAYLR